MSNVGDCFRVPGVVLLALIASLFSLTACGGDSDSSADGKGGASKGGSTGKGGNGGSLNIGGGGSGSGATPGSGGTPGPYQLPAGFTETEFGGYKLGEAFNGDQPP